MPAGFKVFGEATALNNLGVIYLWNLEYGEAETALNEARSLFEEIHSNELFEPLWNLGILSSMRGEHEEGMSLMQSARDSLPL